MVERIVFELFGITPDTTKEAPLWAEPLVAEIPAIRQVVESNAMELAALRAILEAVGSGLLPPDDDPADGPKPPQRVDRRGR